MPNPTIEFHPEADREAEAATDWYAERSLTVAEAFLDELDHALEQIADTPDRWARHLYGTRRYLLKRFPFLVVYRLPSASKVQIVAVAHGSRRPGYWRQRIRD
jgi:plasmid stabilization system protein ParE